MGASSFRRAAKVICGYPWEKPARDICLRSFKSPRGLHQRPFESLPSSRGLLGVFDAFDGSLVDTICMILIPLVITARLVPANVWPYPHRLAEGFDRKEKPPAGCGFLRSYMTFGTLYANWSGAWY